MQRNRRRSAAFGVMLALLVGAVLGVSGSPDTGQAMPGAETAANQVEVVLGVSASMTERFDSEGTKLDATRGAVRDVAAALPEAAQVGLRTYGGGCDTSTLVNPIRRSDPFDAAPEAFNAVEKARPIGYALAQAGRDFATSGRRAVVLVADGVDSCGADPVALARQLAADPAGLCIDVIGLSVSGSARRQLTRVAAAACGDYVDAYDGPSLSAQLRRVSMRALQPVGPKPAPVTGAVRSTAAPLLSPGRYTDVMPADASEGKPRRWYAVRLPAGSTGHFSATISLAAPLNTGITGKLGLKLRTAGNAVCVSDTGFRLSDGGITSVTAAVTIETRRTARPGSCGAPGRYLLELGNVGDRTRSSLAPLELSAVVEPSVTTLSGLPGPVDGPMSPSRPTASAAATVTGGYSFASAPVLDTGSYEDMLHPGERVIYRVPLEFGQRLAARITLPKLSVAARDQLGLGASVELELDNPLHVDVGQGLGTRIVYYVGERQSLTSSTPELRYRNRDSEDETVRLATLPGYYYVSVYLNPDPADPYLRLPIRLDLEVQGERRGGPRYQITEDLPDPAAQLPVSTRPGPDPIERFGDRPNGLAVLGIVVGAVLTVGGSATALVLARRSPRLV